MNTGWLDFKSGERVLTREALANEIENQAATIAQLQLDNEKMRKVLLKVRSIYTDSLNYKWITEALVTQPTLAGHDEAIRREEQEVRIKGLESKAGGAGLYSKL